MRLAFLILLTLAGCRERTEIVIGVATDLRAKGQIDLVRLIASRQGTPIVQTDWPLADLPAGRFELPGSFGLYSGDGSETRFELTLIGYLGADKIAQRDSILSLVANKTLFLRQTLTAACHPMTGPACPGTDSCVEGVCQKREIDTQRLPDFRDELVKSTECDGPTQYIVSTTGDPMPKLGTTCAAGSECHEGTCWKGSTGFTPGLCEEVDGGVPDGGIMPMNGVDIPVEVGRVCDHHLYPYELSIVAGNSLLFSSADGQSHRIQSRFFATPNIRDNPVSIVFNQAGEFTVSCQDHPNDGTLAVHVAP